MSNPHLRLFEVHVSDDRYIVQAYNATFARHEIHAGRCVPNRSCDCDIADVRQLELPDHEGIVTDFSR